MKQVVVYFLILCTSYVSLTCSSSIHKTNRILTNLIDNVSNITGLQLVSNLIETIADKTPLDLVEFVSDLGYPVEEHNVITKDGYNLTLFRIPQGRTNDSETDRPPVLVQHGFLCSAGEWLTVGPERSVALQLADRGYDVWVSNSRGNTYSRRHINLDPDSDKAYWDFSFEDIALMDLSAIVDYILAENGHSKLSYVGHSHGTTLAFILLSTKPEYNKKFLLVNALAPVSYCKHMPSPVIQFLAIFKELIQTVLKVLNINEFLAHNVFLTKVLGAICSPQLNLPFCPIVNDLISGLDPVHVFKEYLPTLFKTFPAGSSVKNLVHIGQLIQSDHFRRYDYGLVGNLARYASAAPPDFPISNIKAPIALYYSTNDFLTGTKDVERLASELPASALVHQQLVDSSTFNHFDFLIAEDINELVYNDVIDLIDEYNGRSPSQSTTMSGTSDSD